MAEYYYHYLGTCPDGKRKQQTYHLILRGLEALEPSFPVPRSDSTELTEIFTLVRLDHPEIFYAPTFSYSVSPQADSVQFAPKYLFRKKDIIEHQNAIRARIQKLIRPAAGSDELSREQYIHDFICQNVRYDKLKKEYSHEIIGPLTQGVGVCEGIAKTVKILCDALQIPCIIVLSRNNPEKGIKYRHAWNIVRLGGTAFHLDATFDGTLSAGAETRYDYFNIDDTAVFRDHEELIWPAPACTDHSRFYYLQKKLSFTKPEEVRSRAAQAVKKNKTLIFHWRGGYLTREVLKELCTILTEEAEAKGKTAMLSLNWPQAVLHVRFESADGIPGQASVSLENANEGELDE